MSKDNPTDIPEISLKLKNLEEKISDQPEIDEDRVKQLRDALASGEFKVDPAKLANKLIDLEDDS